jgi:hypothetical protein
VNDYIRRVAILATVTHCGDKCMLRQGRECAVEMQDLEWDDVVKAYRRTQSCRNCSDIIEPNGGAG